MCNLLAFVIFQMFLITFLVQPVGQVGILQDGSHMYGILTVQFECAKAVLLSLPAASTKIHRSDDEFVGFINAVNSPKGTTSLMAHHAYAPCTSHCSPSFAPDVQYFFVRLSNSFNL